MGSAEQVAVRDRPRDASLCATHASPRVSRPVSLSFGEEEANASLL